MAHSIHNQKGVPPFDSLDTQNQSDRSIAPSKKADVSLERHPDSLALENAGFGNRIGLAFKAPLIWAKRLLLWLKNKLTPFKEKELFEFGPQDKTVDEIDFKDLQTHTLKNKLQPIASEFNKIVTQKQQELKQLQEALGNLKEDWEENLISANEELQQMETSDKETPRNHARESYLHFAITLSQKALSAIKDSRNALDTIHTHLQQSLAQDLVLETLFHPRMWPEFKNSDEAPRLLNNAAANFHLIQKSLEGLQNKFSPLSRQAKSCYQLAKSSESSYNYRKQILEKQKKTPTLSEEELLADKVDRDKDRVSYKANSEIAEIYNLPLKFHAKLMESLFQVNFAIQAL